MSGLKYEIRLSVRGLDNSDEWHVCTSTDSFPIFSDRFVDDIRNPPPYGLGPTFNTVVRALKSREMRQDQMVEAANILAKRLATYIEDKEGWHGESRRERINNNT